MDLSVELDQQADRVDAIDEMRMRSWARRHYEPAAYRRSNLHPIVLDEMRHKDEEATSASPSSNRDFSEIAGSV